MPTQVQGVSLLTHISYTGCARDLFHVDVDLPQSLIPIDLNAEIDTFPRNISST